VKPTAKAAASGGKQGQRTAEAHGSYHAVTEQTGRFFPEKMVVGKRIDDNNVHFMWCIIIIIIA
jgi:hypothetical protein